MKGQSPDLRESVGGVVGTANLYICLLTSANNASHEISNVLSETPYLEDVWSTSSSGWLRLVRSRLYFVL